jgi:uncharacterized protein (DUF736 family)
MEPQMTTQRKTILSKEKKFGGITFPDFKIYCKSTIIKTGWCWYKKQTFRRMEQTESPEINPQIYGELTSNERAKNTQ